MKGWSGPPNVGQKHHCHRHLDIRNVISILNWCISMFVMNVSIKLHSVDHRTTLNVSWIFTCNSCEASAVRLNVRATYLLEFHHLHLHMCVRACIRDRAFVLWVAAEFSPPVLDRRCSLRQRRRRRTSKMTNVIRADGWYRCGTETPTPFNLSVRISQRRRGTWFHFNWMRWWTSCAAKC